ncbi:hypothetical protein JCM19232_4230 [Vibrio ishigakensis]|uniref:LysM domain-containing protein n=1 Tax=Vibrio ishigakensis TaxID=1481914 RepID=A0A0B8PE63_9VIBR|nr:hypothetical protein JCM19232_4230 [Vibrio ishigakensis]
MARRFVLGFTLFLSSGVVSASYEVYGQYNYLSDENNASTNLTSFRLGYEIIPDLSVNAGFGILENDVNAQAEIRKEFPTGNSSMLVMSTGFIYDKNVYASLGYGWELSEKIGLDISYQFNYSVNDNFNSSGVGITLGYQFGSPSSENEYLDNVITTVNNTKIAKIESRDAINSKPNVNNAPTELVDNDSSKEKKLTLEIKEGDTYYYISKRLGVHYYTLMCLNGLDPNYESDTLLYPGKKINIDYIQNDDYYKVKENDNLSRISDEKGISVERLIILNDCPSKRDFSDIFLDEMIRVTEYD